MRDYYYLLELDESPYILSARDALHMASSGEMASYTFISEEIALTDPDTGIFTTDQSFYLRIPSNALQVPEKDFVRDQRNTRGREVYTPQTSTRYVLTSGYLDEKYYGVISGPPPIEKYGEHEQSLLLFRISTTAFKPFEFSLDDIIVWTDELEHLADFGHIQRRKPKPDAPVSAREFQNPGPVTNETQNIERVNIEAELKRAQRTLAALALGLAKNYPSYKIGEKPNASQLARLATDHLRDAQNDRTPHGFSETTARQTISAALRACPELSETN